MPETRNERKRKTDRQTERVREIDDEYELKSNLQLNKYVTQQSGIVLNSLWFVVANVHVAKGHVYVSHYHYHNNDDNHTIIVIKHYLHS